MIVQGHAVSDAVDSAAALIERLGRINIAQHPGRVVHTKGTFVRRQIRVVGEDFLPA